MKDVPDGLAVHDGVVSRIVEERAADSDGRDVFIHMKATSGEGIGFMRFTPSMAESLRLALCDWKKRRDDTVSAPTEAA